MIKQLNIENFQSHKDTTLEFDKGVNVIIGKSDSGKTAIIRALKKVIKNKPGGDAFRSHWGGETKIKLTLDDDQHVMWAKDKGSAKYVYNNTTFTAFGQDVPEEIEKVLNFKEVNLQSQFDQPFLIMETPGTVAQHFNQVAHLEKIDQSVKFIRSEIRQINSNISHEEARNTELTEELKLYDDLDKFEIELEVLEETENNRNTLNKKVNELNALIETIQTLQKEIDKNNEIIKAETKINEILKLYENRKTILKRFNELSDLSDNIYKINEEIASMTLLLSSETKIDSLLTSIAKRDNLTKNYQELSQHIMKIKDLDNALVDINLEIQDLEETFHKEMPDQCPLCGQKIE